MNDSQKILQEFYRVSLSKNATFKSDRLALAAAFCKLTELVRYNHFHLDGDHGIDVVNVKDIDTVIQQLENSNELQ
jgi:hypothetical protein